MPLTLLEIIDKAVATEGGYTDNPADLGGPTIWGITERVARKNGFTANMQTMSRQIAQTIYLREYVQAPGFDRVHAINPLIAAELIDTGINCGQPTAAMMLQRALNALNGQGKVYADVPVDGDCGPATITALRAYLAKRGALGELVMLRTLNGLQLEHYIEISEKRPANEEFTFGWIANRVAI